MRSTSKPRRRTGEALDKTSPRGSARGSTLHFSNGAAADCLEQHTRGETVIGLISLVRQASGRDALRQVPRSGSTGTRTRPAT